MSTENQEKPLWTFARDAWFNPDGTCAGWNAATRAAIAEYERRKAASPTFTQRRQGLGRLLERKSGAMTTEQKLTTIRDKCVELLATAEKRELSRYQDCGCQVCVCEGGNQCYGCGAKNCGNHPVGKIPNPVFIASCAGPAEAGWRATIAAIDSLCEIKKLPFDLWAGDSGTISVADNALDEILAAWEGIL